MTERTLQILQDLEAVRENLLALSDDIWLSIDHNDADALEEGVEFKRTYNAKLSAFDALSSELSQLVQQFTRVDLAEEEESGEDDTQSNERIIEQLNREQPFSIDEDFTFKRPHGFILDGQATTGITTWRRLYELVCITLLRRDHDLFVTLIDHEKFVSSRGHRQFTTDPKELRSPSKISGPLTSGSPLTPTLSPAKPGEREQELYTEINLSANGLRDVIRNLLTVYAIPRESLQIFLREDRDAGKVPYVQHRE